MKKFLWIAGAFLVLASCNQQIEKTGYVNNTRVVSDFKEMKVAQEKGLEVEEVLKITKQNAIDVFSL